MHMPLSVSVANLVDGGDTGSEVFVVPADRLALLFMGGASRVKAAGPAVSTSAQRSGSRDQYHDDSNDKPPHSSPLRKLSTSPRRLASQRRPLEGCSEGTTSSHAASQASTGHADERVLGSGQGGSSTCFSPSRHWLFQRV